MIIAGTGHRPDKLRIGTLDGFHPAVHARLVDLARAALQREAPARVISGMALGWDTALAEAALELGIPFDAYVPFAGQESRWPEPSRRRYQGLLARAERVVIVCPGGYAPEKMQLRNERMVDDADFLLALWDGSSGGTCNCIAYAEAVGRPYRNLWPSWVRHTAAREPAPRTGDPVLAGLLGAAGGLA
ncbi:MAG TPA: SLOG family protein [Longimicrobium sp.]|jgi:uncharacterized phage-like protein YoqJ